MPQLRARGDARPGATGNGGTEGASITADGRCVAFFSSTAFVPDDTNHLLDVYVREREPRP